MSEDKKNSGIESRVPVEIVFENKKTANKVAVNTKPVEIVFDKKPVEITFKENLHKKSIDLPTKTLLPGIESITIDEKQLEILASNADKKVLKSAKDIINNTPISNKIEEVFLLWGTKQQEQYNEVTKSFFLSSINLSINELSKFRGEIAEKLKDLNDIFFEKGILNLLFSYNKKESFDLEYGKLEGIIKRVKVESPKILKLNEDINKNQLLVIEISRAIESYIIAGEYIIHHLEKHKSEKISSDLLVKSKQILRERVISLKVSFININNDDSISFMKEQVLNISTMINETINIDIPNWRLLVLSSILQGNEIKNNNSEIKKLFEGITKKLTNK